MAHFGDVTNLMHISLHTPDLAISGSWPGSGLEALGAPDPGSGHLLLGTCFGGHIWLPEPVLTPESGPLIWHFYALFGPFWPFPQNGHFGVPDP